MTSTINQESILFELRRLMPRRPLSPTEAFRVAELQANRLLESAGIDSPGIPSEIVSGLPFLEVVLKSDLPVSGLTDWYKPRWLIFLNSTEPAGRQRFSLMHEFKHILDHPYIDYLYPQTWAVTSDQRAESVADYFSACLLMPKRLVKRSYYQGGQDVAELAAEYGVSSLAMAIRLQQLGLVDRPPRCEHNRRSPHQTSRGRYLRRSASQAPVVGSRT